MAALAYPRSRRARLIAGLAVLALAAVPLFILRSALAAPASGAEFNYAEALQKAVWFYDAQRLGKLPATNRVSWRGDSFLSDGADAGLDLTGGFADAGDTIKATFPLAHSLTTLAWGMVDDAGGYSASGQSAYLLSNLRWGMDYLIKAHPSANKLVAEVGDPNLDHQLWAAAEVQTYTRQTYFIDSSCGGSDLAGSTAAAFAAASMAFKASDPTYSATLLTHARQLYTFADTVRKKYSDCVPVIQSFYNSWSGYEDELVWGALWLYRATGEAAYLTKARAEYPNLNKQGQGGTVPTYQWTYDWDDKTVADQILMAQVTGEASFVADANRWVDWLTDPAGVGGAKATYSPGGEVFFGTWGSLRYAAGAAWIALAYGDSGRTDATRAQRVHAFAVQQINYILGDNPSKLSYMVGFGGNSVKRPHHRTAHGSSTNNFYDPVEDRHTLYGGMVGGPTAADDNYGAEDRNAFQKAEVALDYNAGLTSALARLVKEYGGTPLSSFPPVETPTGELSVTASLNQASSTFVEIKTLMYNKTAWPARFTPNLSLRYYFTLDAGTSPSQVTFATAYAQCAAPTGPTQYSGNVYYVTVSCAGQNVGPIGQSESRRENQFRIIFPSAHDYTKDWSFTGVSTDQANPTPAQNITLYEGTRLAWGTPPQGSSGSPSPTPSISPSASPSPSVSPSASASPSPSVSPTGSGTVRVQYKNNDSNATDAQIRPGFNLVNGGTSAVALSTVTVRYWFTAEAGAATYSTYCDYAAIGSGNVSSRVVALANPVTGADHYLEVTFSTGAGSLAAGASSGDIQARFNKTDWSAFNEANDYSYGTGTSYVDASRITAYVNGQLVWGSEPR